MGSMNMRRALPGMLAVCLIAVALAPDSLAAFQVYCIDGASNNVQWAWKISGTGDSCENVNTGPVTPSGNEATDEANFAIVFRDSINGSCSSAPSLGIVASVASESTRNIYCPSPAVSSAFAVQASEPVDLAVGPAGSTPSSSPCAGGSNGIVGDQTNCNFNPEIIKGTAPVPSIGVAGGVVLVALVLAAAAWILARRARSSGVPA